MEKPKTRIKELRDKWEAYKKDPSKFTEEEIKRLKKLALGAGIYLG